MLRCLVTRQFVLQALRRSGTRLGSTRRKEGLLGIASFVLHGNTCVRKATHSPFDFFSCTRCNGASTRISAFRQRIGTLELLLPTAVDRTLAELEILELRGEIAKIEVS